MHFCVFVMIGPNTDTDTDTAVEAALAPFDESLKVDQFRLYMDHSEITMMAKHYGTCPAKLHELPAHMHDWRGAEGGLDRHGLYWLSNSNPDGRWDWYEIGGRWDCQIHSHGNVVPAHRLLRSKSLKKCVPYQVLSPDGEWLEYERFYPGAKWGATIHEKMPEQEWLRVVRKTLLRWPDYRVVCVDIHC